MYSLNSAVTRGLCPAATNHWSDERSYLNRIDTFGHQFYIILGLWIPQHGWCGTTTHTCLLVSNLNHACLWLHPRVSSLVASASEGPGELRRCRYPIWPEWSEAEVNTEKWDAAKGAKDGKMGKSPFLVSIDGLGLVKII